MSLASDVEKLEHNYTQSTKLLDEILNTLELNIQRNLLDFHSSAAKINFQGWINRWKKRAEQIVS